MTTAPENAFISIQNIVKDYGSVRAVDDVSIDITKGEFFSLLGASGCGKTTLLRMLAGFETASAGEILLDGQPMSGVPPHHRPVNMVFQNYAIFPHLSVRDNIAYGLRKQKLSRAKRYDLVEEILGLIKLPGYGTRKANELSGGQRQRVALARALILKPKVLLLDEPLGALDKKLREQMQLELRALQQAVGITFVFVTHDQEEAMTLSDRIAVMASGKVLQIDTPSGLYENPRSREVASFIGNMNFFSGRVITVTSGSAGIDAEGLGQVTAGAGDFVFDAGDRVQVALRPEKLSMTHDRPAGGNVMAGHLDTAAYLGERSHFYVQVDGLDQRVAVSAQNDFRAARGGQLQQGMPVWLSWSDESVVVLGAD